MHLAFKLKIEIDLDSSFYNSFTNYDENIKSLFICSLRNISHSWPLLILKMKTEQTSIKTVMQQNIEKPRYEYTETQEKHRVTPIFELR